MTVQRHPIIDLPPGERHRRATSLPLLSHLRWISALVVVLSHIEQNILSRAGSPAGSSPFGFGLVTKPLFRQEGYGHAAVVVFFVLSGFLVGGKLVELAGSRAVGRDWPAYLVDRFTRIFVVLWPALLLTGIVFGGLVWLVPAAPFMQDGNWAVDLISPITADHAVTRWAAAAFLLNELVAPTLDTDGPLWSLAYEWSYYVIGLAAVLAYRRIFSAAALLAVGYGAALVLISVVNQPDVVFSGLSWLAGLAARLLFDRAALRSRISQIGGVAAVIAVLALQRRYPLPDLALASALALMIAHAGWANWTWGAWLGERLAGFSYSLYALHYPLLLAVMGALFAAGLLPHPLAFGPLGFAVAGATLLFIVGTASLFAALTEGQTPKLRRFMMRAMRLRSHRTDTSRALRPAASADGDAAVGPNPRNF
jgi:peptidoglycan/LPS O-acetylase OafA/YrhL